jgi:hypothetical protein
VLIPGNSQGNYLCSRNSKIITWALQKPVTMAIPVRGIIPRQGFDIVTGTSHLCGEHLLDSDLKLWWVGIAVITLHMVDIS